MSDELASISPPEHLSPFEKIKRINKAGAEFWSSRDFAATLGYTNYRTFEQVIDKARLACLNSGQRAEDHFVEADDMVGIGSGGQRASRNSNQHRRRV
jgi:DNA-damage-inducible protein D